MVEQLKEIFGSIRTDSCISSDDREKFYITENERTACSYIVDKNEKCELDECFIIRNISKKQIHHLSVDACFLTPEYGYEGSKCDFAVFDNEKFCFVELKTNAYSEKRVESTLKIARKQLITTINYFKEKEVDFSEYSLEAYIVLKDNLYPNTSADKQRRKINFYDKCEVELFEESETEF